LNVVTTAAVPGCVGGVPLMWFVPLSEHATVVGGTAPFDAAAQPLTTKPAGPVIVGVL
jgi:hypothetical protein